MNAHDLIDAYFAAHGKPKKVDQRTYASMQKWMEDYLQKHMRRPFFYTGGKGGGQMYRMYWLIFDVLNNKNTPSIFYTEMPKVDWYLRKHGNHKSLQDWIDDTDPRLLY